MSPAASRASLTRCASVKALALSSAMRAFPSAAIAAVKRRATSKSSSACASASRASAADVRNRARATRAPRCPAISTDCSICRMFWALRCPPRDVCSRPYANDGLAQLPRLALVRRRRGDRRSCRSNRGTARARRELRRAQRNLRGQHAGRCAERCAQREDECDHNRRLRRSSHRSSAREPSRKDASRHACEHACEHACVMQNDCRHVGRFRDVEERADTPDYPASATRNHQKTLQTVAGPMCGARSKTVSLSRREELAIAEERCRPGRGGPT
jgi:hypothetical protein